MKRTLIEAGWVVGHENGGHVLIRDGCVVFEGDRIVFVGQQFDGPVDERISAPDGLVAPGFVDSHVHSGHRALHRLISDTGRPELLGQPFLEVNMPREGTAVQGDPRHAAGSGYEDQAVFTVTELLRNGITSFLEFGSNAKVQTQMADVVERMGIRAWLGPGYESGQWVADEKGRRRRRVDEARGMQELDEAVAFIDEFDGHANGRVTGILVPREVDTCSVPLLERTRDVAKERNLIVATHASYNPWEFSEVLAEHGCTPIELLHQVGLLGERTILGHCNFVAMEGRLNFAGGHDLELIAAAGATVSHCPVNLMRRGRVLDSWSIYRKAGVRIALGTDTYPRDMIGQMRAASYMGKMLARDFFAASATEVFNAATLTGAQMLGRDDIGRLAPGAKADIQIISTRPEGSLRYGPIRDPIRSLVECGIGDDVRTVFVDGVKRVDNGAVIGVDMAKVMATAQADSERIWSRVQDSDALGRTAEQRNPWSFPMKGRCCQP